MTRRQLLLLLQVDLGDYEDAKEADLQVLKKAKLIVEISPGEYQVKHKVSEKIAALLTLL